MGLAAVQSSVETAIRTWQPSTIVLMGIAGSLEADEVKLGDVIVPSKVFGYVQFKNEGKKIAWRPTGDRVDSDLFALARGVGLNNLESWRSSCLNSGLSDETIKKRLAIAGGNGPRLHIHENDNIASGNAVVASKLAATKLRAAFGDIGPTLKAVEMEATGLCEAIAKVNPRPQALVVRGISDLADETKSKHEKRYKNGWRRYAAQNAGRFVLRLIGERPQIAEGYRHVGQLLVPMMCLPDSAVRCMEARMKGTGKGMTMFAFAPLLSSDFGLPATELTLVARKLDGTPTSFEEVRLRHTVNHQVFAPNPEPIGISYRLERTGEPPPLELLLALRPGTASIQLTAKDEFGRTVCASWPRQEVR
jgi:nucleoside phosphorylase